MPGRRALPILAYTRAQEPEPEIPPASPPEVTPGEEPLGVPDEMPVEVPAEQPVEVPAEQPMEIPTGVPPEFRSLAQYTPRWEPVRARVRPQGDS